VEEMNRKESILIVDDDESSHRSLTLIFGRKGYETETAGTGREAIEKAQRRFFNLALLDIKLPDMQGLELLAPLKHLHPDMLVIMVTAYASTKTAIRAMNEGASAYITKPLDMDEVLATVNQALANQRLVEEKRQAQEALQKAHDELERRVEERTAKLAATTEQLKL
jgi:DNA-binding NtrC family response regulator